MKNTIFTSKNLILSAFLLSFLVVSVSFAQEEGVVAGAGPSYEETPTPTAVVTVSPTSSPVVSTSPAPVATPPAEEQSFWMTLLNSLGLWWLLVLAIVIAVSVYLSRKKRSESPTP